MVLVIDLQEMLADLEALVNAESPSNHHELLQQSAACLSDIFVRRLGHAPTIVPSAHGPHLHWKGGGEPKVLIVGHHDTVFPVGTVAARPFAINDGKATGPGVFDMKAGLIQAIHGVAELADRSGVEFFINSDEEIGSTESRELIEQAALRCGAVLVFEASADGGALKTARKGTGTFEVVVHGRASHAGLEPEKGINSITAVAELTAKVITFADPSKGTTVTPTMVVGGTADNVVPAQTVLTVDCRVEQAGEKERLEACFASLAVHSVPGATVELRGGLNRPPMPKSASTTLFPLAVEAAQQVGIGDIAGVHVGGGSDGNFTAAVGVPTLDGLGAVGGGAHADHEFVLVEHLVPRAKLVTALIERL
jgi:glutamate carboxypeptidase